MKRFVLVLISTFCILTALYMMFIAAIDPFYVFHMPIGGMEPIQTNRAHYVARGLIRNADYDMLICGSSMCENIHIDDVNDLFYNGTGKCLKVVQHGSYSNDLRASLEAAAEAGKADVIIMALDTSMFQKDNEGYRTKLPSYATDKISVLNIWPYLLNKDVFQFAMDLIMQNARDDVQSQDSWWILSDENYSEKSLLASYKSEILDNGFRNFDLEKAWDNLKNIEKGVEACQEQGIEIKFFIPPYSVAVWDCRDYQAELMTYKELWRELLGYSNVTLYAVQFDGSIITDFDNYRNVSHYSEAVCSEILRDISEGRYQLTTENIDEEVDGFVNLLDEYNWDSLRNKLTLY